ncbi:hypothetical protein ALFP_0363 [Alcaligenes faecalis]|nr:hypothetical protein ALFP_0363 [Alcaligenes faecalis]
MIKVFQDFEALGDDGVARLAFDVCDKSDAAGVVFISGEVQALGLGGTGVCHGRIRKERVKAVHLLQRKK